MAVFRLFEKVRYSNERYLEEEDAKKIDLEIAPRIESLYGLVRLAT